MSPQQSFWCLDRIEVCDVLGFQGRRSFSFRRGRMAVKAPNHTGKTSFTLALLWCFTGEIPALARINKTSFRLANKLAGQNARPEVVVSLSGDSGRRMTIKRIYRPRVNLEEDLDVDVDGTSLTGQEAQNLIAAELGIKPGSLEGCGVILQDHRLKLITGKDSDISEVINDMLGLYTLSQLVPVLEEGRKSTDSLKKQVGDHVEAADPLKKWEEQRAQLEREFKAAEDAALAAGFKASELERPLEMAHSELTDVAERLKAGKAADAATVQAEVKRLRDWLGAARKSGPEAGRLAGLLAGKAKVESLSKRMDRISIRFSGCGNELTAEAAGGTMDEGELATIIAAADGVLARNRIRRAQLEEEQGFLSAAYNHLLSHQREDRCPLCRSEVSVTDLVARTKVRISADIVRELDDLRESDVEKKAAKEKAEQRLARLRDLKTTLHEILEEVADLAVTLKEERFALRRTADAEALFVEPVARAQLQSSLLLAGTELKNDLARADDGIGRETEALAKSEEETYGPADTRINRTMELLVPVATAQVALETHGTLRDKAEKQKSDLEGLADELKRFASQLKKVTEALNEHEQAAAAAAVQSKMPQISALFRQVAANPHYDGLSIETSISRGAVAYGIRATSSNVAGLDDAVGHVLSEGDLSAAGMALLFGLATGDRHHLGFMVLDDPAQGMDDALQENFAKALSGLGKPDQLLVLTHQTSFAEALKKQGTDLVEWQDWR